MSFGKKSSAPAAPTPTFTPQAGPTTITRTANTAEAQDRMAQTKAPESSLLASGGSQDEEELRRRHAPATAGGGMY
jgi:hypothetical protein